MLYSLYSALCQLYLNKTGRKKMSFTCISPSATAIWHPSMDKSTLVGAVGSSTWYLRAQEKYCPPICQIIAIQSLVPAVDPEMHHELTPAPLGHCLGAPGAQAIKEKIDELSFIKIKKFCALNDTIKHVKRQPTEWDKNLCKSYI